MPRKTIAQLEAELQAAKERNEQLEARNQRLQATGRTWLSTGVFANTRPDRRPTDPDWRATPLRLVAPKDLTMGEPLWIDINLRVYDAETCPLKFDDKKTLPEFIVGARPCSESFAARQEAQRNEALAR